MESGKWISFAKATEIEEKWKVESGKWKVESGKWKVESGKWKVESGKIESLKVSTFAEVPVDEESLKGPVHGSHHLR